MSVRLWLPPELLPFMLLLPTIEKWMHLTQHSTFT